MMKVFALFATVALASAAPAFEPNLVELAASVPDLSTLVTAVKAGGLVPTLEGPGPFTVFAPTNEAFAALPEGTVAKLLKPANKALLVKVLTYHVVSGKVLSSDLSNGESIKTVEGGNLTVRVVGSSVFIDGDSKNDVATVTSANNMASNGVAHIINKVLIPISMYAELGMPLEGNIIEVAESVPTLSTLVTAVKAAGLVDTLEGPGPFTVLAPTNDAFNKLPEGLLKKLLEPANKPELVKVLTYHVLAAKIMSSDLTDGEVAKTVEGSNITVHIRNGHVYFEGSSMKNIAEVLEADVGASNGVVHVIDEVLVPGDLLNEIAMSLSPAVGNIVEVAESVPELSTLVTAVKAAGLVDTLEGPGPFTVLAPTNDAFDKLPAGILKKLLEPANKEALVKVLTYHVIAAKIMSSDLTDGEVAKTVEGKNLTVHIRSGHVYFEGASMKNIAEVLKADVEASNGVVHVIDEVLIPSDYMMELVAPSIPNIVQLAASVPDLSTLVTAVQAGGLVDTLEGPGPFTVFAPTNEAFDALPAGVLANLLKPENKAELVKILTFHVVSGAVTSGELKDEEKVKTIEGDDVTVHILKGHVFIEGGSVIALVKTANVMASNGVVHIITKVLLPSQLDQYIL